MANPEHVATLKKGADVWNSWRKTKAIDSIDLSGADLRGISFNRINLRKVNLAGANLKGVDLSFLYLHRANLIEANLDETDLTESDLGRANLSKADLRNANLSGTNLIAANLTSTDLSHANLNRADLFHANLNQTILIGSNFKKANLGLTLLTNLDMSTTENLSTVVHDAPSTLGIDTIFQSKGKIPEIFLRGCGISETLIAFLPSMMEEAIQFYSCFISYSHADKEFAKRLHDRLQGIGIRCWLDEHQLNPGDKLHSTIYDAIRLYDKVILCCSETALKSWWVEKEFENVIAKEEDFHEPLLIPVSLDNYLFEQTTDEWIIGEIRKKRFVQDFVNWKDHDAFEQSFKAVVKSLRTDGGKPPPPESKLTKR